MDDYKKYIFKSDLINSVVIEAINFFKKSNLIDFPINIQFPGTGVYSLFYIGDTKPYQKLGQYNNICREIDPQKMIPIYVGKAVPAGRRTGAVLSNNNSNNLYRRLNEHKKSIQLGDNLKIDDFVCKIIILNEIETDLISPIESALIREYVPLWNKTIDGFGNHDPGKGRYNQKISEWDFLHPGRKWAEKLPPLKVSYADIQDKINEHFNDLKLP